MNRRDLLAALAAGLLWRGGRPRRRASRARAPWTFRLSRDFRWSLVARDGGAAVSGAALETTLAGAEATPLAALAGVRHFPLADPHGSHAGWQVVGVLDGVEIAARFLDGPPPVITVTARGLAEARRLDELRFFDTWTAQIPAVTAQASVWINGYGSSDPCALAQLADAGDFTSHWQLALLSRAQAHPLALGFGVDDAGEGRFTRAGDRLVAVSRFAGRPVGAQLPPASATLTLVSAPDPLDALAQLAAAPSHAAAPGRDAPTGWIFRPGSAANGSETDFLANLDAARTALGAGRPEVILLDDGYQRAAGAWETNERFPHGHRWLTDRIHAAGWRAGLWLAPFAVAERSGIPTAHPEWLLQDPAGDPLLLEERADWGGRTFGLDAALPDVRDYLRDLARHVVSEWGYDALELGRLSYGTAGSRLGRDMSPAEAYRAAMRALREGAAGAFLLGTDAPLQQAAGLVDAMRITPPVEADFASLHSAARAVALRAHWHESAWLNDPGCLTVREPLTLEEARLWAAVVALSGGIRLGCDPPAAAPPDRFELLRRTVPVVPVLTRAFDLAAESPGGEDFPAWLLVRLAEDWWMLAAMNWGDAARRFSFPLADHGVRGPLAAYDVWADERRADVDGRLTLELAPHASAVLALRRRRTAPGVIGSTRHVVQGMDLRDERWDARQRTLSARSVQLDGRPYAVTIALPPGFRPRQATASPETEVAIAPAGPRAARLVMAAPPGPEVEWGIEF